MEMIKNFGIYFSVVPICYDQSHTSGKESVQIPLPSIMVTKIQILSSRALHSVAVTLLSHHIWLHGLMIMTYDLFHRLAIGILIVLLPTTSKN